MLLLSRTTTLLWVGAVLLIFNCAPELEEQPVEAKPRFQIIKNEILGCDSADRKPMHQAFDGTTLVGCCRPKDPQKGVQVNLTFNRPPVSSDRLFIVNGSTNSSKERLNRPGAGSVELQSMKGRDKTTFNLERVDLLDTEVGSLDVERLTLVFFPVRAKDSLCITEIHTGPEGDVARYKSISVENFEPIKELLKRGYYLKDQESRFLLADEGEIEPFQGGYDCGPIVSGSWGENTDGLYIDLIWDSRMGEPCSDEKKSTLSSTDRQIRSGEFKGIIESIDCPDIGEESCVIRWKSGATLQFHLFS